jgi:hypothetical protein
MDKWRQKLVPGLIPWAAAFLAAVALVVLHPFTGDLDRGSILAIAGLILGIAAVTVGLISVLAQHLSETYARSLVKALLGRSTWQSAAIAEAVSLIVVLALALWRSDLTTGAVAGIALCASLFASWNALLHLFRHFDPVGLIELEKEDALQRLQAEEGAPATARQPSESILSLIVDGARKGDTDVVRAGLSAWNEILQRYLQLHTVVWNDEYFYWLYARVEELIERNAKESVGLVLPAIVEGVSTLGSTAAKVRNRLNANLDEGTTLLTEALVHVVELSATSRRSPAAELAAQGIGEIGLSCLEVEKFTVLQDPVEALVKIAIGTAEKVPGLSRRAMVALGQILLALAASESNDVMRSANAERIVKHLPQVIARDAGKDIGPSYVLVAPMSEVSLARLVQALAVARDNEDRDYRQRSWDNLATAVAGLVPEIYARRSRGSYLGPGTIETAGATILGLLCVEPRDAIDEVVEGLARWLNELSLADGEQHHPADEVMAVVCPATYVASDPPGTQRQVLRGVSSNFANGVRKANAQQRRRLSPILRQVGAAALDFGDQPMADLMAANTLPPLPRQSGIGLDLDPFSFGLHGIPILLSRPGLPLPSLPNVGQDPALQQRFLALERQAHVARPRRSRTEMADHNETP